MTGPVVTLVPPGRGSARRSPRPTPGDQAEALAARLAAAIAHAPVAVGLDALALAQARTMARAAPGLMASDAGAAHAADLCRLYLPDEVAAARGAAPPSPARLAERDLARGQLRAHLLAALSPR